MAEDEDEGAADVFEAVPAGEVAEISPEDEAAGQAAIDAMGFGETEESAVSISDLTDVATNAALREIDGDNAVNEVGVELSVVLGRNRHAHQPVAENGPWRRDRAELHGR